MPMSPALPTPGTPRRALPPGQGAALIPESKPAGDVVRDIMAEAEGILQRWGAAGADLKPSAKQ